MEQQTHLSSDKSHGSVGSYIIGFVLSLIFTVIPYYWVVNKTFAGTALLLAILGIAVLQMFIQLLFFLHLGRGPKPLYNVVFFFATAGIIVITIGASLFIMDNLYRNMTPDEVTLRQAQKEGIAEISHESTGACKENKKNHIVTLKNGMSDPTHVMAKHCDTLTFINGDNHERELIFRTEGGEVSYGGEDSVVLDDGRPETITLNETGIFIFQDRETPALSGHFMVEP